MLTWTKIVVTALVVPVLGMQGSRTESMTLSSNGLREQTESFRQDNGEIVVENAMLKISESLNIPAQRNGVLTQLVVSEGQIVFPGDEIGRVDDEEAQLKLHQAEIDLQIASRQVEDDIDVRYSQKSLQVAESELGRANELRDSAFNLISETEYQRLQLVVSRTELEIERAQIDTEILRLRQAAKENELRIREADCQRYEVTSPIEGMVVSIDKRQGEWVEASDTIIRLVRIDRLRVEGMIPAELAAEGLIGRKVRISEIVGQNEVTAEGHVVFLNPEAITVGARLRIWAEVENVDRKLFPGLNCTMTILPAETDED